MITSDYEFRLWLANPLAFWLKPEDHEIRTMLTDIGQARPELRIRINSLLANANDIDFDRELATIFNIIMNKRNEPKLIDWID
jgi:hypothetical protein